MPTALVTGANRGIGLELCKQLEDAGYSVLAVCRRSSDALSALKARVIPDIDVGSDSAVDQLRDRIGDMKLDVVINNAGILRRETLDDLNFDSMRQQFEVNALGPLRVASATAESIVNGGKLAIITSRMGSIADNTSGARYGYRMSKAAVNIAGVSLAHDLRTREIAVALIHPGYVRTEMTANSGTVEPADAARGILDRIDALSLDTSGRFWHANGEPLPW